MVLSIIFLAWAVVGAPLIHINQTSNLPTANRTILDHDFAQSWVPPSTVRSSWEILYTCVTALIACFIKFVPLNVPAYEDSTTTKYRRKLKWLVLTIFVPEMVFYRAWQQYQDAKDLKQDLDTLWQKFEGPKFNLPQGFGPRATESSLNETNETTKKNSANLYGERTAASTNADAISKDTKGKKESGGLTGKEKAATTENEKATSKENTATENNDTLIRKKDQAPTSRWLCHIAVNGGLVVDVSDIHDTLKRVTLSRNGVKKLAEHGFFLSAPDRTLKELRKGDDLGQAIALWQLTWLFITIIARWASHLPVSLLELNTFINIMFAFTFYLFWFWYSIDLAHPIVIDDTSFRDYTALFLEASLPGLFPKDLYRGLDRLEYSISSDNFRKQFAINKIKEQKETTKPTNRSSNVASETRDTEYQLNPAVQDHRIRALSEDPPSLPSDRHLGPCSNDANADDVKVDISIYPPSMKHGVSELTACKHSSEAQQDGTLKIVGAHPILPDSYFTRRDKKRWELAGAAALKEAWEAESPPTKPTGLVKMTFIEDGNMFINRVENVRLGKMNYTPDVWRKPKAVYEHLRLMGLRLQSVLFFSVALAIHGALHLIAWHWTFPTSIEMLLWKLACFGLILGLLPQALVIGIDKAFYLASLFCERHPTWGKRTEWCRTASRCMNEKVPPVSLCLLVLVTTVSSTYLFTESFLALRSSPAGVYKRIHWSVFLPSIG